MASSRSSTKRKHDVFVKTEDDGQADPLPPPMPPPKRTHEDELGMLRKIMALPESSVQSLLWRAYKTDLGMETGINKELEKHSKDEDPELDDIQIFDYSGLDISLGIGHVIVIEIVGEVMAVAGGV